MKWMYSVMIITLRCPKCQHLWKFPFTLNLSQVLICISLAFAARQFVKCFWKEEVMTQRALALQSPWDRPGDRGFILKTDYCFLTAQCLAFNPMDHTGWIALLILSFPTATAGSEETATWESSSITVLHQSRDVNQKYWRNAPHRTVWQTF